MNFRDAMDAIALLQTTHQQARKQTTTLQGEIDRSMLDVVHARLNHCLPEQTDQAKSIPIMSYAARARRTQAGGAAETKAAPQTTSASVSRPQLHSRKHSANSAGDVFAMLGQPKPSKVSAARDKDRTTTIQEQSITEEPASVQRVHSKGRAADDSPSSPSSSSPTTASSSLPTTGEASIKSVHGHGRPSPKRYKTLYSKPTLLKLWKSQLSVTAVFDEVYSAFEVRH